MYIYVYPNDSAEREKPCNQYKNQTVFHSGVIFPEPPEIMLYSSTRNDCMHPAYYGTSINPVVGTAKLFASTALSFTKS